MQAGFYKPTKEWIFGSYGGDTEQLWYWAFGASDACNGNNATKKSLQEQVQLVMN